MDKELIKQAYQLGYLAAVEKRGQAGAVLADVLAHTVPGIVAGHASDSVNKDPDKYWSRGKKYFLGGLAAKLLSLGLLPTPLAPVGMLGVLGGTASTLYGANSAIASAVAKRRKNNN